MSTVVQYKTYEEFYPYYLSQHRHPFNRKVSAVGTGIAVFGFLSGIWYLNFLTILSSFIFLIIIPMFGHYIVVKNKPLIFKYPQWTLMADFRLAYLVLFKEIKQELEKYKITSLENDWKGRREDKDH